MTADFIQIELFAIFIAVGIGICIWGIWKIVETLAEEYDKEQKNKDVLGKIRDEIERLHYHPKLDFIKNDEVVEMALDIINKYRGDANDNN